MTKNQNYNSSEGTSFPGLLTLLFIGLKLTHYIDWSWYWVLSPVWIPLAVLLSIFLIYGLVRVAGMFIKPFRKGSR